LHFAKITAFYAVIRIGFLSNQSRTVKGKVFPEKFCCAAKRAVTENSLRRCGVDTLFFKQNGLEAVLNQWKVWVLI
jgi:hypothetical protein